MEQQKKLLVKKKKKNKIIEKELRRSDYIKFTKIETSNDKKVESRTKSIDKLVDEVRNKSGQEGLSASELLRLERQVKSLDKFLAINILSNKQDEKVKEVKEKSDKIFKKKAKKQIFKNKCNYIVIKQLN